MVACAKCESVNSLDSLFCKRCGHALPAEELAAAGQKLDELLKDGFASFNAGDAGAAMSVAETVLLANPSSASGWSLRGLAHEHQGHLGAALESYERAVEFNPASTLDKIKVAQLRAKFDGPSQVKPGSSRTYAATGAAATIVLVVAVGALFGSMTAKADDPVIKKTPLDMATSEPLAEGSVLVRSEPPAEPKAEPKAPAVKEPVFDRGPRPRDWAPGPGYKPVEIEGTIGLPWVGDKAKGGKDPEPAIRKKPEPPKPPPPVGPLAQEEPKDPGTYEITVSKGGAKGGNDSTPKDEKGQLLLAMAETQFLSGQYAEAAAGFFVALKAGADPGKCNQRLGDCYRNLGQRGQAIGAYHRAASSYETGGNAADASACRQAMRELLGE